MNESTSVLEMVQTITGDSRLFVGALGQEVRLSNFDWDDFGRPSTITVTIQPGDTLNGEIR